MEIRFEITNDELAAGINRALAAASDFTPAMLEIAGLLEVTTRQRFEDEKDPTGARWKRSARAEKQQGQTLRDTGSLESDMNGQWDAFNAIVGTNLPQGRIHQAGGIQQVSAHQRTVNSIFGRRLDQPIIQQVSAHSRDVPQRAFLGFGVEEQDRIPQILTDHLERAFRGRPL